MSIAISNLSTVCRVRGRDASTTARGLARSIDRIAHERLGPEVAAGAGPALDRQPAVIRIRRLEVRLHIPASGMSEDAIAQEWAGALIRALFQALAYPDGHNAVEIQRFLSRASYVAALLDAVLRGGTLRAWVFDDLMPAGQTSARRILLSAIRNEPDILAPVLLELDDRGLLVTCLAALDEITTEELIRLQAGSGRPAPEKLSVELLARAAGLMLAERPTPLWTLSDARQALRAWALAMRDGKWPAGLRALLYSLQALRWILKYVPWPDAAARDTKLNPEAERALNVLADPVKKALREFSSPPSHLPDRRREIQEIAQAVAALQSTLDEPGGTAAARELHIDSAWMGLMLLSGAVLRLGWWDRLVADGVLPGAAGVRAFSYLLCSVGCAVMEREIGPQTAIDPAAMLFAGIVGEIDRAGLNEFVSTANPGIRAALDLEAVTWPQGLAALSELLMRAFAERIRGFRRASLSFVRNELLRRPGRAVVTDSRILAALDSNAWSPALHISGAADAVAAPWLAPRHLEFRLEGL